MSDLFIWSMTHLTGYIAVAASILAVFAIGIRSAVVQLFRRNKS